MAVNFYNLGCQYTQHDPTNHSHSIGSRRFLALFGVAPEICSLLWEMFPANKILNANPNHLLWALLFLKSYGTEQQNRAIVGVDEKTFRNWSWYFVELIADLKVVKWQERFENAVPGQTCFTSIDGIDCRIAEPTPRSSKWYSHKFHKSGLRYEIALNIRTGKIVWAHGGYACGEFPDLKIARLQFVHHMRSGEKAMADLGYRDARYFITPNHENSIFHKRVMARHETVNARIKNFGVLKNVFRHPLKKHGQCFLAVVNLVQLSLVNGSPLYEI